MQKGPESGPFSRGPPGAATRCSAQTASIRLRAMEDLTTRFARIEEKLQQIKDYL